MWELQESPRKPSAISSITSVYFKTIHESLLTLVIFWSVKIEIAF